MRWILIKLIFGFALFSGALGSQPNISNEQFLTEQYERNGDGRTKHLNERLRNFQLNIIPGLSAIVKRPRTKDAIFRLRKRENIVETDDRLQLENLISELQQVGLDDDLIQEHMKVDMRRPRRRPGEFRLKKSLGTRQGNRKDNFRLKRGMHLNSNPNPEYFEGIEYY